MNVPESHNASANQFASLAREFCGAIDSSAGLDRTELLIRVYRILPQLIAAGIVLPNLELDDGASEEEERKRSQARDKARLTQEQWGALYESLKTLLGDWNLYWQVWDPTKDSEAIHGSLADDLADIYRDLREGLDLRDSGRTTPEDNVWHWRVLYYSHWGKHAIDALRTIHFLLEGTLS